mgnify:CR=1 FL=1
MENNYGFYTIAAMFTVFFAIALYDSHQDKKLKKRKFKGKEVIVLTKSLSVYSKDAIKQNSMKSIQSSNNKSNEKDPEDLTEQG